MVLSRGRLWSIYAEHVAPRVAALTWKCRALCGTGWRRQLLSNRDNGIHLRHEAGVARVPKQMRLFRLVQRLRRKKQPSMRRLATPATIKKV